MTQCSSILITLRPTRLARTYILHFMAINKASCIKKLSVPIGTDACLSGFWHSALS